MVIGINNRKTQKIVGVFLLLMSVLYSWVLFTGVLPAMNMQVHAGLMIVILGLVSALLGGSGIAGVGLGIALMKPFLVVYFPVLASFHIATLILIGVMLDLAIMFAFKKDKRIKYRYTNKGEK